MAESTCCKAARKLRGTKCPICLKPIRVRIEGRQGYSANSTDMYALLGVSSGKLPAEGMPERLIQGVRVYVRPLDITAHHRACIRCGLDVEGMSGPNPDWRDRGNNTYCPRTRRKHNGGRIRRNWQGLRVMAICNCGQHVPVGRLHQHKCKE